MNLVANKAIEYFEIFELSKLFDLKTLSDQQFGMVVAEKYEIYYLSRGRKIRCYVYSDTTNGPVPYTYISDLNRDRAISETSVDTILEDPVVSDEIKTFIIFNIDMFRG